MSRYNPNPQSFEYGTAKNVPVPIKEVIHRTFPGPIKPPILITLFGSSRNHYTVQGEIEQGEAPEELTWVPY